jgi:DNA replication factor GINS
VNLDELRSVQSAERQSDALQHLRDGFYQDAGEYVQELCEQRRVAAERAADPYGDEEVRRLTDEIETAKAVTEAIWEARIGKILREASLSATDMSASADGLTPEEAALFERVVEAIETNRETIQDALEDAESVPPDDPGSDPSSDDVSKETEEGERSQMEPTDQSDSPSTAPEELRESSPGDGDGDVGSDTVQQGEPDRSTSETSEDAAEGTALDRQDRVRVRITQDVGTIAGVDGREYHLATDDVAELPDANARPLVERDAAEVLE